jgi:hypothetical protein
MMGRFDRLCLTLPLQNQYYLVEHNANSVFLIRDLSNHNTGKQEFSEHIKEAACPNATLRLDESQGGLRPRRS